MIFVTGDIHGEYSRFESKKLKKLTESDHLIVCGDFGFIWDDSKHERHILKKLCQKRYKILFVEGTHDNYRLINNYPITDLYGGRVQKISDNIFHMMRGEIYTIENKTFFTFGGGESSDKELRSENGSWWPEEQPSIEEMAYAIQNLDSYERTVDYIITHQPSMTDMALIDRRCTISPISTFFDELSKNVTYKKWYFGYIHKNKEISNSHCLFTDIVKI